MKRPFNVCFRLTKKKKKESFDNLSLIFLSCHFLRSPVSFFAADMKAETDQVRVKWSSAGGERASAVQHFDRTLSRLISAGIHHHAPPHIKTFFLPTGCTIRSLLSGLGSGGCKGSKKWALSLWIMPLFQLLWPGMPNFTARYSSLCVNQSFARDRGARWVRPPPPAPHDPIRPAIPLKPDPTSSFRALWGDSSPAPCAFLITIRRVFNEVRFWRAIGGA